MLFRKVHPLYAFEEGTPVPSASQRGVLTSFGADIKVHPKVHPVPQRYSTPRGLI